MPEITLTLSQARALMLAAQGLISPPGRPAVKTDILSAIRRIHNLQIDTISVVARAHLHILWSRLGVYEPRWLEELHAEGALFEYWAHAACLLPIEDYPLYRSL
ncbi:MAG: crosslink repair DNA glycosylase YcaQ family protein, partial [Anaerolineaceae bacterium]